MNKFGRLFKVSLYGESHGEGLGCVVDGVPPGIELNEEILWNDILRRKAGAEGTTPREERDEPHILNGVFEGRTTGAPVHIHFHNTNTRSRDYSQFRRVPRPGHADLTSTYKYSGYNDLRGSGHFSGRITLGLVAAGTIARQILAPASIEASLTEAGGEKDIIGAVRKAKEAGDSIGGIISCSVKGLPKGLGEPFFDSAESLIAHAVFAVPGVRGLEFGTGFAAAKMHGFEHNDSIADGSGTTITNHHAGINGGITNGNELYFKVAMKPTSSISKPQETYNFEKKEMAVLEVEGRHDTCFALRVPVVIESAAAIALADLALTDRGIWAESRKY